MEYEQHLPTEGPEGAADRELKEQELEDVAGGSGGSAGGGPTPHH
jgi:hypothetical protein